MEFAYVGRMPISRRSASLLAVTASLAALPAVALAVDPGSDPVTGWSWGSDGNDQLTGTPGDDKICGLGGDDVIDGGAGVDDLRGDGTLLTGVGFTNCDGDAGPGAGNDTLRSGPGSASQPSDLFGGPGHDTLEGGPDFDFLYGGDGNDRVRAGGSEGSTRDWLNGTDGNDTLTGSSDGDVLSGGAGRNVLKGGAGNDDLYVPRGKDKGKNKYSAGSGDDYVFSSNGIRERVNCGPGRDQVYPDKRDTLVGCEKRVTTGPFGPAKERPNFGKPGGGGGGGPRGGGGR